MLYFYTMKIRKHVSKENILERVNQFDIFKHYIVNFEAIGVMFKSELRQDKNPTCCIGKYGDKLFYRDFALSGVLDCFGYIMQNYNISYYDSLEMINLDFNLQLLSTSNFSHTPRPAIQTDFDITKVEHIPAEIKVKVRKWTLHDKLYWNDKYGITINELKHFKVFPLSGIWLRGNYYKCGNNTYGYYFGVYEDGRQGWKIYQPKDKKHKWITNGLETIFQGFNQLPDKGKRLVITKSLKDVIVLYKLGIPAIAPQAESIIITIDFLNQLRLRFDEIMLIYDNDGPGKEATIRIAEQHLLPYFYMPDDVKDASDFVEKYGIDDLDIFIEEQWKKHIT